MQNKWPWLARNTWIAGFGVGGGFMSTLGCAVALIGKLQLSIGYLLLSIVIFIGSILLFLLNDKLNPD